MRPMLSISTTVTSIRAERWLSVEMQRGHNGYSAAIPGDYTNSVYPLQYYFALQRGADAAWLYPAFNSSLSNQPYYAIAKEEWFLTLGEVRHDRCRFRLPHAA